jgi:hypothetical protein
MSEVRGNKGSGQWLVARAESAINAAPRPEDSHLVPGVEKIDAERGKGVGYPFLPRVPFRPGAPKKSELRYLPPQTPLRIRRPRRRVWASPDYVLRNSLATPGVRWEEQGGARKTAYCLPEFLAMIDNR